MYGFSARVALPFPLGKLISAQRKDHGKRTLEIWRVYIVHREEAVCAVLEVFSSPVWDAAHGHDRGWMERVGYRKLDYQITIR
jgi:hypothetical protein